MPPNQRRLAENDALVELIQTTEYLDDVPTWGQRDYRLYPLTMVILFIEEEVEGEIEVEEDENGFRKGRWIDLMEDLEEDIPKILEQKYHKQQQCNQKGKRKIGLCLSMQREGKMKQRDVR